MLRDLVPLRGGRRRHCDPRRHRSRLTKSESAGGARRRGVERTWVGVSGGPQPPRNGTMTYDLARHQTVLLVPGHPSQTWVFGGATRRWSQKFPVTSPALAGAAIAFDAARGYVVLFGSNADPSTCNPGVPGETWTWNGTTWTQLHPAVAPDECAGLGATMVYDAAHQRDLVVCDCTFRATWLWDGVN